MFTENLDTYLQDFGVTVAWGMVSGLGLIDMPDDVIAEGFSISTDYSVIVKSSLFAGVRRGDSLTVDSIAYTAKEFKRLADGAFGRIYLSKS